jgi:hypothetical protein
MSVIIEAYSCVIKVDAIKKLYEGGLSAFIRAIPNQTFCTDGDLCRIGFMREGDLYAYANTLRDSGIAHDVDEKQRQQKFIAFTMQGKGFIFPCDWLEITVHYFDEFKTKIYGCALKESNNHVLATQEHWSLENHLSLNTVKQEDMNIVGHEGGNDVIEVDGIKQYVGSPYSIPYGTKLQ